ncbi:discoidin domain-containing protein [Thalassotalea euphylliae]|uniref:discoidin domain-containing protein n=1 Tax=Thalassotalea euphylliae TaxID=1655234 RepID=UPI0015F25428|nr:discoidin domain-containing protein [Thalassotalea euphylliae]
MLLKILLFNLPSALANNVQGNWGPVINWPQIAISGATLPDGRVLTWSSTETNAFPANREFTHASVFDPNTGRFVTANSNFHDMFCAGISTLEDGTIVASGGNPDDQKTSSFNPNTLAWTPLANMNDRRWYGTNITMPSNQIWSTFAKSSGNRSELYDPATNTWTRTPNASMQTLVDEQNFINSRPSPRNTSNLEWFGHMALTPDGKVFHGGPTPTWHVFDPLGGQNNQSLGRPIGDLARMYGNVVSYDAGKVILLGGYDKRRDQPVLNSNVLLVDLNGPTPAITRGAPMNFARAFNNTVTMPNGELLIVGGNTSARIFNDEGSIFPAEIYNPSTNRWRVVDSISVPRNYHSIALLLKDGRVLSAGGGGCGNTCNANHLNGQIYSPPYLFNADGSAATRPVIQNSAAIASAGETIRVTASADTQRFSLVRLSGTTHHVNTDQRFLPVSSTKNADGSFNLRLNANPNVLIPGNYWLFALNANGTPSIGQTIQIVRKKNISSLRYLRLTALTETNNSPFAAIAEINLLNANGRPINRANWTVSTSSAELDRANLPATNAIDGDRNTFWHSSWSNPDNRLPPHQFIIDMGARQDVSALTYLPRQDKTNGHIRNYAIHISEDGINWGEPLQEGRFTVDALNTVALEQYQPPRPKGENVALNKQATLSSVRFNGVAERAIDGRTNSTWNDITHTEFQRNAWLEVDLGAVYNLTDINIWNRTDCCTARLSNFTVFISDSPFTSQDINITRNQRGVTSLSHPNTVVVTSTLKANRTGRYVRVQLEQVNALNIAELEIFGTPAFSNVALGKQVSQSSTVHQGVATRANDGNTDGRYGQGSVTHTRYDNNAWWEIDLGAIHDITTVKLWNRTDGWQHRLAKFHIFVSDRPFTNKNVTTTRNQLEVKTITNPDRVNVSQEFAINRTGRYLRIQRYEQGNLSLAEVEIEGFLPPERVIDTDNDGVPDAQDAFPNDASESVDTDGDGVGDNADVFPRNPAESQDSDGDGVGDNADPFPQDPSRDGSIAALPEPPRHSTTLLVEQYQGQDRIWNVNPDNNSVSVTTSDGIVREISVGNTPWAIALSPSSGNIYVTNKSSASISIISAESLQVIQTVNLPIHSQPHGIVFNASGDNYYLVLEASAELEQRNSADNSVIKQLKLPGAPRHLAMSYDDSKLLVSNFISPFVAGEDTDNIDVNDANAEVFVVDPQAMILVDTYKIPFDVTPMSESRGPGLPNYLAAPAISYDSMFAYIPGKKDNIIAGTLRGNPGMTFDQTVRAHTSSIALNDGSIRAGIDHDNASVATGAAYSGDSRFLLITLETSRELVVFDTVLGFELMRLETGRAPQSVAFSSDGSRAYVHNFMDRSISRYDLTEAMRTGLPVREILSTIAVVNSDELSATVLKGKQLFYDAADTRLARDSYMSCASCHKEAKHDGRVWDMTQFGEGLRNTISLRGKAAIGHGFLHWTGNFDEIQDFEGQIRNLAGGSGLMSNADFNTGTRRQPLGDSKAGISADLDALAAYLASLTEVEVSPSTANSALANLAQQGKELFQQHQCSSCHTGVITTDSATGQRHDIGTLDSDSGSRLAQTLDGFDTPSLLGLWNSAPYLHDGSAATVSEAITAHSTSNNVSQEEANAIAAFLMQLDGSALTSRVQVGSITANHTGTQTSLTGFVAPRVVMGAPTHFGGDPSVVRITERNNNSFSARIQEWDYLDDWHLNETVSFLALENGRSSLGDLAAEAGQSQLNQNWQTIRFSQSFTVAPVVFAQTVSTNEASAVTVRIRNITAQGFELRIQEQEGADGVHALENVDWIAIEPGITSTKDGKRWQVGKTERVVTNDFYRINFAEPLSNPAFIAGMQSYFGGDVAAMRYINLGETGAEVRIEEERSKDEEILHVREVIGFIAVSQPE